MTYSSAFNQAFADILKTEGGLVDHPYDRGGLTNYGLTQATVELYYGREVSREEMRKLTPLKAKEIYAKFYWYVPRINNLPDEIGAAVFDQAVNRGPNTAIRMLQRVLGIEGDGIIGPVTIEAAQALPPHTLIRRYCKEAAREYARIVRSDASQVVFLEGWLNRVFQILERHNA